MRTKLGKTVLVGATLLGMVVSAASAQALTYGPFSFPTTPPPPTITQATTEINQTGSLGLFDSTLGILTGATLTLYGEATFSFSGTNNASQQQNANITSSTELLFSSTLAPVNGIISLTTIPLSASSGIQMYAVGETKNFGPFAASDTEVFNLAAILAFLQAPGGGTFDITGTSLSGLTVQGGGGNISTTQATTAGIGAAIVYEYEPRTQVPEPALMLLMGVGLVGTAYRARRKK